MSGAAGARAGWVALGVERAADERALLGVQYVGTGVRRDCQLHLHLQSSVPCIRLTLIISDDL